MFSHANCGRLGIKMEIMHARLHDRTKNYVLVCELGLMRPQTSNHTTWCCYSNWCHHPKRNMNTSFPMPPSEWKTITMWPPSRPLWASTFTNVTTWKPMKMERIFLLLTNLNVADEQYILLSQTQLLTPAMPLYIHVHCTPEIGVNLTRTGSSRPWTMDTKWFHQEA